MASRRKQKKLLTHIAIVLDASSSMGSIQYPTIEAFNRVVRNIRERAKAENQDATITLITFGYDARKEYAGEPIEKVQEMNSGTYRPFGNTALLDGLGLSIVEMEKLPFADSKDTSFLVLVITDGDENNSSVYKSTAANMVRNRLQSGRWTFAMQGPRGSRRLLEGWGILPGCIEEWDTTEAGTRVAAQANVVGTSSYFAARSKGHRAVDSFYVQTDMSKVKPKDIQRNLDDLSDQYKVYEVPAETVIKDFVELKTRRSYVIGAAYYQLTKTEKVQPQKQLLIMEKGKKAVWGGQQARDLIGLPTGADAKVVPGNHAGYDIYVQSTSVNRKLVRGTKVLVNTTQRGDAKPTWSTTSKRRTLAGV